MNSVLIRNARLINEGREFDGDLLVDHGRIVKITRSIEGENAATEIDAKGQWLLPGMIDDQGEACDLSAILKTVEIKSKRSQPAAAPTGAWGSLGNYGGTRSA